MRLGPYDVYFTRDTGKPRFRVWSWRVPPVTDIDRKPTYRWIFKILSWWTLFVARRG